jgi:hypothetical protein
VNEKDPPRSIAYGNGHRRHNAVGHRRPRIVVVIDAPHAYSMAQFIRTAVRKLGKPRLLRVCTGCNVCRPRAIYVNVGCRIQAATS